MRIHLFEFEDLPWFPAVLRNAMTAYLAASWKMLPVGVAWAPLLQRALAASPVPRVIDLCSGSGGPLPEVLAALNQPPLAVVRTDLYPSSTDILAVDARHVFEATRRHPVALLLTVIVPLLVLVLTPRVRPVRPLALLFTYLIPILPLLIAWDGFVSHLRTYSVDELKSFTAELSAPGYAWEAGELSLPGAPFRLPYVIGLPVSPAMP
ncbi:MAG: hypothetical protein ABI693_16155 [Bryobacteraceae bacterium]